MLTRTRARFGTKFGIPARGETEEPIRMCSANKGLISGMKGIAYPTYDRSHVSPGVVNLGLRNFHRVHNAVFFDNLLSIPSNSGWGMISVALSEPQRKLVPEMKVQNSLYSVVSKSADGMSDIRVIGSVLDCMVATGDSVRISDLIGTKNIRMVTLTLKETNYHFTPDFSRLNDKDPHVRFDMMAGPRIAQRTPVGILVTGLYKRFKNKGEPLTVLSCENIQRNGEVARAMIEQYAVLRYPMEPAFHRWLSVNVFYPNSMCDRICLTDPSNDRMSLQQLYGIRDNALLTTESFNEWVVEKWMGDKPEGMKDVGIKMVGSTVPYENLKIRFNYGTRLSVAILAKALGYDRFEDALKEHAIAKFAERYMTEVTPGLGDIPKDIDLEHYKKEMMKRIATPELNYMTYRVVESASKKIRSDIQPVLDILTLNQRSYPTVSIAMAAWIHLLAESPLCQKTAHPVIDINLDSLETLAKEVIAAMKTSGGEAVCKKWVSDIFGAEVRFADSLSSQLHKALGDMEKYGIKETVLRNIM
jgi:mannitol 2-dehydrogenase